MFTGPLQLYDWIEIVGVCLIGIIKDNLLFNEWNYKRYYKVIVANLIFRIAIWYLKLSDHLFQNMIFFVRLTEAILN